MADTHVSCSFSRSVLLVLFVFFLPYDLTPLVRRDGYGFLQNSSGSSSSSSGIEDGNFLRRTRNNHPLKPGSALVHGRGRNAAALPLAPRCNHENVVFLVLFGGVYDNSARCCCLGAAQERVALDCAEGGLFTLHDVGAYAWKEDWQLEDDQAYMEVYILVDDDLNLRDCQIKYEPFQLSVTIRGEQVLNGTLRHRIRPDLCCHEIDILYGNRVRNEKYLNKRCLFIQLAKFEWKIWKTLLEDEATTQTYDQAHNITSEYE
eukprot:jgi/Bigna1/85332/estExt_fgenesh1_pg.C_30276